MKLFLDSSAIIAFIKGDKSVRETLKEAETVCTSAVCAYEVLFGERYREAKGVKASYAEVSNLFATIDTLPVTLEDASKASEIAAVLEARGKRTDDFDVIIAAQAIKNGAGVLTKDARHFNVLKQEVGLQVIMA